MQSAAMSELLDPQMRAGATVLMAGVALHGLLAGPTHGHSDEAIVEAAFSLARVFLAAAEKEMA